MLSKEAQAVAEGMLKANAKAVFSEKAALMGVWEQAKGIFPEDYQLPAYVSEQVKVGEEKASDGTRCLIFEPKEGTTQPVTALYFHGGGFVLELDDPQIGFCMRLANEVGARVILPLYSLAPHANVERMFDCVASCYELACQDAPSRLVVAGDSAGGNLAVCCAQMALQRGLRVPDLLIGISPWLDLENRLAEKRITIEAADILLGMVGMREIPLLWDREVIEHESFPPCAFHGPIEGLCPTVLTCATTEILKFDALEFAERLEGAGVDVTLIEGEGLWHVFPVTDGVPECIAVADKLIDRVRALL